MSDCGKASWEALELQRERVAHNATKAETKRLREALQLVKDKKTSRWHPSDPVLAIINSALAGGEQQNTNKG